MALREGYKQTEVGVIPEDWDVNPLFQVAEIRGGIAKNTNIEATDPISVHYLRVANVQDGFLDLSEMSKIQLSRHDLKRYMVLPGDVLMNEGGDLDKLGRGAIWHSELNPCVHQNHVFVVRCKSGLLPSFLNVWTGTSPARRFFLLTGKQTTNLASISKSSLSGLPVAVPPLPEQRAIATALSDMDALLEGLDQLIAKKRNLKQATMQQLLTGKTRLPGFEEEWEAVSAGDIGRFRGGSGFPVRFQGTASGEYPFFKVSDMNNEGNETFMKNANNYISDEIRRQLGAAAFPVNSIVFAKVGAAVFLERKKILKQKSCLDNNMAAYVLDDSRAYYRFIHYVLLDTKLGELVSITALPSLGGKVLAALKFILPSIKEQTAIATVLSDMDAEIESLQQRRAKTRDLKQAMMQELLTGKTRLISNKEC